MMVLGLIAGVSICISLVFWVIGAPLILSFALVESLLLVAAFLYHAKAMCDFDERPLFGGATRAPRPNQRVPIYTWFVSRVDDR